MHIVLDDSNDIDNSNNNERPVLVHPDLGGAQLVPDDLVAGHRVGLAVPVVRRPTTATTTTTTTTTTTITTNNN